jgi:hypothetical protein
MASARAIDGSASNMRPNVATVLAAASADARVNRAAPALRGESRLPSEGASAARSAAAGAARVRVPPRFGFEGGGPTLETLGVVALLPHLLLRSTLFASRCALFPGETEIAKSLKPHPHRTTSWRPAEHVDTNPPPPSQATHTSRCRVTRLASLAGEFLAREHVARFPIVSAPARIAASGRRTYRRGRSDTSGGSFV